VGSGKRSPLLPELPTIAEAVVPGVESYTWAEMFVLKATSKVVVDKLHAKAVKAVNDPGVRARLRDIACDPVESPAEGLGRLTREGYGRMGELIRKIGLKPQEAVGNYGP
jgi:tripartite-type tricarboxylate transporter receptor subunit TctC